MIEHNLVVCVMNINFWIVLVHCLVSFFVAR